MFNGVKYTFFLCTQYLRFSFPGFPMAGIFFSTTKPLQVQALNGDLQFLSLHHKHYVKHPAPTRPVAYIHFRLQTQSICTLNPNFICP